MLNLVPHMFKNFKARSLTAEILGFMRNKIIISIHFKIKILRVN